MLEICSNPRCSQILAIVFASNRDGYSRHNLLIVDGLSPVSSAKDFWLIPRSARISLRLLLILIRLGSGQNFATLIQYHNDMMLLS